MSTQHLSKVMLAIIITFILSEILLQVSGTTTIEASVTVCGMQQTQASSSRIVGGEDSQPGEWPWMLSYNNYGTHFCGASLISEQWAITAAHCVSSTSWMNITAGITTLDDNSVFRASVRIAETFIHPEYDDDVYYNDIALLRLDSPVQFNKFVQPICYESLEYLPDTVCHVAGWGLLAEYGTYPNTLQDTSVPLLSIEECRRLLFKFNVTDNMICAGYASGGRDTCSNDSGGPLMCKSDDGTWNLVGITSWGVGCARPNRPGVYTKVSKYAEFIQQTINVSTVGVVTNNEKTVSTPKMFTTTSLPRQEALPKEVLTVVDVDMHVTASDVKEGCASDPSLANCPDLIKEFEEEFGQAYYNFDLDAYHGLIVTNISSLDDTWLKVHITDNKQLIVHHFVEYKYTEFNQSITNDQFIKGVFGNNAIYGKFTYDDSSVDIDTDFCNEKYYYPCESSFTFRCNDKHEPECASKCEVEFNWCNGGSCDAIGDEISCK
ncbi:serine protease 33-like [Anneissia japonica]|uniref:serine protease 33-like n=1 Tax=Anneissia japonica TaxID=1529436 RepID=UPI0014258264|nr:serine protease 33-like [Anneissia japonica]